MRKMSDCCKPVIAVPRRYVTSFTVLVIVIAPSMVQMHTAPRVVDIVSYLKVCHEKWSPATVLSHIAEAVKGIQHLIF